MCPLEFLSLVLLLQILLQFLEEVDSVQEHAVRTIDKPQLRVPGDTPSLSERDNIALVSLVNFNWWNENQMNKFHTTAIPFENVLLLELSIQFRLCTLKKWYTGWPYEGESQVLSGMYIRNFLYEFKRVTVFLYFRFLYLHH